MACEHQDTGFCLCMGAQRDVNSHLVAIEVSIECLTNQWVELNSLTIHELWLECLNSKAVQRWCTVEHHGMLLDHLFECIPDLWAHPFNHPLGCLDIACRTIVNQRLHDEWLEELKCHFLWQAALVQLEFRTNNDNGTSRVVNTLSEQVLAEPAFLALEHVRKRLECTTIGTRYWALTTSVVNKCIDGFLQQTLLMVDNRLRCPDFLNLLQAVVTVDNTAVQVIKVRRRKTSTIELNHWTQLRRDDRYTVEDHPLWTALRIDERGKDIEALDRTHNLWTRCIIGACSLTQTRLLLKFLDVLTNLALLDIEVDFLKQLTDGCTTLACLNNRVKRFIYTISDDIEEGFNQPPLVFIDKGLLVDVRHQVQCLAELGDTVFRILCFLLNTVMHALLKLNNFFFGQRLTNWLSLWIFVILDDASVSDFLSGFLTVLTNRDIALFTNSFRFLIDGTGEFIHTCSDGSLVDTCDDVALEVQDFLKWPWRHVKDKREWAWNTLEVPDMAHRG